MSGTNSLLVGGFMGNNTSSTSYGLIAGAINNNSTEANVSSKMHTACTLSNFGACADDLVGTSMSTYLVRNGGANGNETISFTFGSASPTWISDATHSDSVVADNLVCIKNSAGSVGVLNTVTIQCNSTNPYVQYVMGLNGSWTLSTTAVYAGVLGMLNGGSMQTTEEDRALTRAEEAGTASRLQWYQSTLSSGTTTIQFRNAGGNGNQVLSISSSTTGLAQDTTHSDSITAATDIDHKLSSTNSSGTGTFIAIDFVGSSAAHMAQSAYNNNTGNSSALYEPIGGYLNANTTEAIVATQIPYACTASKLKIRSFATSTGTVISRIATSTGNQTVSISSAQGVVADTTHSDSITATNDLHTKLSTTGSFFFSQIGFTLDDGSASGHTWNVSVTDSLTLSETVNFNATWALSASDTLVLSDAAGANANWALSASDSLTLAESVVGVANDVAGSTDTLTLSEAVTGVVTVGGQISRAIVIVMR